MTRMDSSFSPLSITYPLKSNMKKIDFRRPAADHVLRNWVYPSAGQNTISGTRFIFQILRGVSYYHSLNIVHRDLNPRNVLIDLESNSVKLADFGVSRALDGAEAAKYSGDVEGLPYKAPELLLGSEYSTAVDIWSVGCIFTEMVTKKALFIGSSETDIKIQIFGTFGASNDQSGLTSASEKFLETSMLPSQRRQKLADVILGLDSDGLNLLSEMLCPDPHTRITADDALKHPYFIDI